VRRYSRRLLLGQIVSATATHPQEPDTAHGAAMTVRRVVPSVVPESGEATSKAQRARNPADRHNRGAAG
jgi:hypothetical protein